MLTPDLNLPFGIQPVNPVPVDSFYGPYANVAQAKASVPLALRYDGLTVQITGSGNYWWLDADLTDTGLVPKVGGGGYEPDYITIGLNTANELEVLNPGEIVTTSNGLTKTLSNITLGGPLTQHTEITGSGLYDLSLGTFASKLNIVGIFADTQIALQTSAGAITSQIVVNTASTTMSYADGVGTGNVAIGASGVTLYTQPTAGTTNYFRIRTTDGSVTNNGTNNRFIVQDDANLKGIVYWADYSANFTPESLVTKRYVDATVGGISGLSSVLALGNTTGANNISINTTQSIVSGNGGGQIDLDYGGDPSIVVISNDNGTLASAFLALSADQTSLTLAGDGLYIDSINGSMLSYGTSYLRVFPDGNIKLDAQNKVIIQTPASLQYITGTEAVGKVLTSDALGNASWEFPVGGNPPDNVTIGLNTAGELEILAIPGATTADNGLTMTLDNIQLGGNLIQNTSINGVIETYNFEVVQVNYLTLSSSEALFETASGRLTMDSMLSCELNSLGNDLRLTTGPGVSNMYISTDSGSITFTWTDGISTSNTFELSQTGNVFTDNIEEKGISYAADYSLANSIPNNPRWIPDKDYVDSAISNVAVQVIPPEDKFMLSILSGSGDEELATLDTITYTPVNGCYVEVKYNGIEYEVGNGIKTKSFYFSGDGGVTARGFLNTHPNGQVQAGDELYFNQSIAGFILESNFRISLMYLRTI
jgi:hypothetical protein